VKALFYVVFWLSISNGVLANGLDLEYIRTQYEKAAIDKDVCETMIIELSKKAETNLHMAYLGAYQTIWASHTKGVMSKFSTFNKGKKNIEKAVMNEPQNIEIRMIRLSIQTNCPSFLNYNDDIADDKQYLEKYQNTVESVILRRMINQLLNE
jgi:hypothetical protein